MARPDGKINLSKEEEASGGLSNDQAQSLLNATAAPVADQAQQAQAEQRAALAKIKVDPKDVQYLVNELEISAEKADRLLRVNNNDVVAVLKAAVMQK